MQAINEKEFLIQALRCMSFFHSDSADDPRNGSGYRLFQEVPVHCLTVENGERNVEETFSYQVIDILICRGREAIMAVLFDQLRQDIAEPFATYLKDVCCLSLNTDELSEETTKSLCRSVYLQLFCDRKNQRHSGCFLDCMPLTDAIYSLRKPALSRKVRTDYQSLLKEKNLIFADGTVTSYGRYCGIYRGSPVGGEKTGYVISSDSAQKLKNALAWKDDCAAINSLESRLSRLNQGLPSSATGHEAGMVRKLLQTPLEELLHKRGDDFSRLNILLTRAQFLSNGSSVSAFGEKEDIVTFGDAISAVRNLWEYTAGRDIRNEEVVNVCEEILFKITDPLWTKIKEEPGQKEKPAKRQGLQARLKRLHTDLYDITFSLLPLAHYFYGAACLTESEYPLLLYRNSTLPWLAQNTDPQSDAKNMYFFMALKKISDLYESGDSEKSAECFPMLYDILVEPVGGIV